VAEETIGRDAAGGAPAGARQSWNDARAAAASAGVSVRTLHDLAALREAESLYCAVWRTDDGSPPVTAELMRALAHAGGYVSGGYDGERMVASGMGFLTGDRHGLHSHIAAVLPDAHGRGIGWALKLHQRAWALSNGLQTISWTFDPLLRRNAWFNIAKLGARAGGLPRELLWRHGGFGKPR
jgi:predicted GNAT superfamily acetyltransferase